MVDDEPSLYLYRLRMGSHEQTGLAGNFSVDEYDRGLIKKHERTRKDKEDDRTRHILEVHAQTGVVFLTYKSTPPIDMLMRRRPPAGRCTTSAPRMACRIRFGGSPGPTSRRWSPHLRHSRRSTSPTAIIGRRARRGPGRPWRRRAAGRPTPSDSSPSRFPTAEVQILPYHRVVKDLAGQTPSAFLAAISQRMRVSPGPPAPARAGDVSMFLAGKWHTVSLPRPAVGTSTSDALDVAVLEREVLAPFLKIGDIRADKRVEFVGGVRGTHELERLVTSGGHAVAFSMFPVSIRDLISIADAGGIMPPKSTWFEPKLRDGLLVHMI